MDILLLASHFNGLTQRAWCALRGAGHGVAVELVSAHRTAEGLADAVHAASPDLVVCPFPRDPLPADVWRKWPTVVVHPAPPGERDPSALEHAIVDQTAQWGVCALSATEDLASGPVWASRVFPMPSGSPTLTALHNGPLADAAMACIEEATAKAADPDFKPTPQDEPPRPPPGPGERDLDWSRPAEEIVRRIRAADSSPGLRTEIEGNPVQVYDAAAGERRPRRFYPGTIIGRDGDAVAVAAGDRAVWIGRARRPADRGGDGVKLPASMVLVDDPVPEIPAPQALRECVYARRGDVGVLTLRCHDGAMSTRQCERIAAVLEDALAQDTRVLVVRGTSEYFSTGIHLGVIEAAEDSATEAWANVGALNALCTALASCTRQLTVAAFTAGAAAGGVMFGLAADVVVARDGVVLNPYYDIGLYGSQLHTYTLPRRVGAATASRLLDAKLPVDACDAVGVGLVDAVGPRDPDEFGDWLEELARSYADPRWHAEATAAKLRVLAGSRPPAYYAALEMSEMARDIFDDRSGFASGRAAFVHKRPPADTPARLTSRGWSLARV
ncbi:MAG: enoyl-CoA hydratase-related protein [Stackebrandtia sp.]